MKDNKKVLVVALLGLALVAVGVFQFSGMSNPPKPKKVTAKQDSGQPSPAGETGEAQQPKPEKPLDPQREALMQMVTGPLPTRDPFSPIAAATPNPEPEKVDPVKVAPPTPDPVKRRTAPRQYVPDRPDVPPVDPLPGRLDDPANGGSGPKKGLEITDAKPLRIPGEFAYAVKGVVVGRKPMAVFEDDAGNQRLVPIGGSVDMDSKVVGIEKGKVRIRHRGKDKTLTLSEGQ